MDVGLEDAAREDGHGVAEVADDVPGNRSDVEELGLAWRADLQAANASIREQGDAAKVGVRRLGKHISASTGPYADMHTCASRPGGRFC
jgi:hypothetical protein